jgi:deoxycytidylate deaminase
VRRHIDDARSRDLVFAVVGQIGAGASWVAKKLTEELQGVHYHASIIKVSKHIKDTAHYLTDSEFPDKVKLDDKGYERTLALQDAGDALRKRYGNSFIAGLAIRAMHGMREARAEVAHQVFILDSLKHPDEVDALRDVYGRSFYLVSVVCHPEQRKQRLELKYKEAVDPATAVARLMERDYAGTEKHGQKVGKTLHLGDFFVRNDYPDDSRRGNERLIDDLRRLRDIVTRNGVLRPTRDERGMYAAWGASLRSSCLSRQVGAAILDSLGEILATGTNDVPRFRGGLYQDGDEQDYRCFRWERPYVHRGERKTKMPQCHNDKEKQEIYRDIYERLRDAKVLIDSADESIVRSCVEETRVRGLIEFSRAVHAEMDAIISLTRKGGSSSVDTQLYCTTYPCHSCARHIVAAGIKEVIYIEPYDKSMARDLHEDSIYESTSTQPEIQGKVCFRLFSGVAPRRFSALFEKREDLKNKQGEFIQPKTKGHHDQVFTETFLDFERKIAERIERKLNDGEVSS